MKKVIVTLLLASMILTSVFAQAEKEKTGYKFGYTCMDQSNPFFVLIEKTIRDEVEAKGDTLISVDPANDVTRQI